MRLVCCVLAGSAALGLLGCGSSPPKPTPANAMLVVAGDANPDDTGRPSPVVVRVYQLKEEGAFNDADYFALIDHEQQALGSALLAREEYELAPGQSRKIELKIAPDARFLGAIAGFRDIGNAHWKALSPTPKKGLRDLLRTQKLTISISRSAIGIAVGK
jgi:type VI secretion system protein VasD